jgi:hypothetical protein
MGSGTPELEPTEPRFGGSCHHYRLQRNRCHPQERQASRVIRCHQSPHAALEMGPPTRQTQSICVQCSSLRHTIACKTASARCARGWSTPNDAIHDMPSGDIVAQQGALSAEVSRTQTAKPQDSSMTIIIVSMVDVNHDGNTHHGHLPSLSHELVLNLSPIERAERPRICAIC